ncbi:hypothetical protein [Nocardia sp. NPDC051570]|uniref:hypothetical protein n=1 Tax=Nocardia sp. NPDC051570 TaxID=3364324 RepID=UPI00379DC354
MQLVYSAEWHDHSSVGSTVAISQYVGRVEFSSYRWSYLWTVEYGEDAAIIELGRCGDDAEARDAVEKAIRAHAELNVR